MRFKKLYTKDGVIFVIMIIIENFVDNILMFIDVFGFRAYPPLVLYVRKYTCYNVTKIRYCRPFFDVDVKLIIIIDDQ